MINRFNQTLTYLESVLDSEIDKKKIQQLSGYSYPMFSRLFSVLAEMTLSEYLRKRRLSEAVQDLKVSSDKVVDIAMKYGYDSADSFSAAFKKFHGATPSEVRNGRPYKVFPKVQLSLKISGGKKMNITIENKAAFAVAGVLAAGIESEDCPKVWDKLYATYDSDCLKKLGNAQLFGVCSELSAGKGISYLAGVDVTDKKQAQKLGLTILEVEEAEYAVVPVRGNVPDSIHEAWKYVLEVFFPENGYRHSGAPDFEVYAEGDIHADDYEMALWIPIVKEG
ncbi:AraC family transcriptional regulator [Streptococcus equinus]|uniref:AraC family transcriptional regulator n=1 Tax=Streptococcus equinus TaxID=1335 RepID=A0A1H0M2R7_STREI|nr:AraC family transcriptional regulator [Streptococcus equinus]SDO74685.1 AraC family transcriptional regulator [Streptococcus equinus]